MISRRLFGSCDTHPGTEASFIVDGEATLLVQGRPNVALQPGTGFMIPAEVPHEVRNGGKPLRVAATYVVEKGEPLSTPAPAEGARPADQLRAVCCLERFHQPPPRA